VKEIEELASLKSGVKKVSRRDLSFAISEVNQNRPKYIGSSFCKFAAFFL